MKYLKSKGKLKPLSATFSGVATLFALAALSATPVRSLAADGAGHVKGRVVVMLRAGMSDDAVDKVMRPHGGKAKRIGGSNLYIVELPLSASEVSVKQSLGQHPMVKFAELDAIFKPALVPNDPYLGSQWHLDKISAPAAWDSASGSGVTIAILDSGIVSSHPDLSSRIVPGWNFYNNSADTSDMNGHGTVVAGAAAATSNNGTGVASVAGAAKIMPLRITDSTGAATGAMVAQALTYAADRGVRVANISYEGVPGNSTVQSAAQYMKSKGGLVVVAAGNTGTNLNLPAETTMIPVSATDSADAVASWSSFGNYVAVAAPGTGIWTTDQGGGYRTASGTSFSSPITAGVVALMMSARPDLSNTKIESLLYSSAKDIGGAGRDIYYGYGRIDAAAAVAAAISSTTSDTQAPSVAISSPAGGVSVSGLVPVDASASDNVGVTRVELRVNGTPVATDLVAPYQFSWDSSAVANGSYTLTAYAFDAAGNSKASSNVSVSVGNAVVGVVTDTTAPTVAISNPANGSRIGSMVSVALSLADNAGCGGIASSLYIDGALVASGSGCSLAYKWNARKVSAGTHTIQAVARDMAGNSSATSVQVSK